MCVCVCVCVSVRQYGGGGGGGDGECSVQANYNAVIRGDAIIPRNYSIEDVQE